MKVKEYLKEFKDGSENISPSMVVSIILNKFIQETHSLIKARNAQKTSAYLSVINEMQIKWKILNKTHPEFFPLNAYMEEINKKKEIKEKTQVNPVGVVNEFTPLAFLSSDEKEVMNEGKKRFQQSKGHRS